MGRYGTPSALSYGMVFSQSEWLRGRRRCTLKEDSLHIDACDGRTSKSFDVPLSVLSDQTAQLHGRPIVPIIFVCGFGALALLCLSAAIIGPALEARLTAGFGTLCFGFAACAGLARWRQLSVDILVFYNRFNGSPVFNLFRNNPSPQAFSRFVTTLIDRIRGAQPSVAISNSSVPAQIEAYARLLERRLISESDFDRIRRQLLETTFGGPKQIGFGA
jgi:hypothetical protein